MFSVVLVKCSDWVSIRESSVSTVSTKCEVAILQCQHTHKHKLYLGCVSFYRKRYSGLPSLQNKCFLFLNLLDWHYQHKKESSFSSGDLCIMYISVESWTAKMMLYPNSAGTSPLTVLNDQIIGVVRYRSDHFRDRKFPGGGRRAH